MKRSIEEMVKNLKDTGELLQTLIEMSYEVAEVYTNGFRGIRKVSL